MSQVKIYQEGGKTPTPGQKYTFKINGNELVDLDHEKAQSWFNDYMKAGGGKTKNRDEWNTDFNGFLGKVKDANSRGEYFDLDLQGDTVGAITAPTGISNSDQGLKDNGKAAKPGLGAGITGVQNQTARNSALLGGLSEYVRKSYDATTKEKQRIADEAKAKETADADKLKQEASKKYGDRVSNYTSNFLDPRSSFKNIDGTPASMEYALKQYHTADGRGKLNLISKMGTTAATEFKSLYDESRSNPEYQKLFDEKFGPDANKKIADFGTEKFNPKGFLQGAYGEGFDLFTNPKTWQAQQKAEVVNTLKPNADGTFSGSDGNTYLDEKGASMADGRLGNNLTYNKGKLVNGLFNGIHYKNGLEFDGEEGGIKYQGGTAYSGIDIDPKDLQDINQWDRTNYKNIPLRLEGRKISLDELTGKVQNDPKYKGLASTVKQILDMGKFGEGELENNWIKSDNIDRNSYNPYEGIEGSVPQYYKNLSGSFSGFDPSKGALLEEYNGKTDKYGNPITQLFYRRSGSGRIQSNIVRDQLGMFNLVTANGEKIPLGSSLDETSKKDLSGNKYNFSGSKQDRSKLSYQTKGGARTMILGGYNKEGGKLEKLRTIKFQYGGIVGSGGGKEKYREVGTDIFDKNYKMTTTDKFQLGALAADIGSLALTAAPGVGNVAAAGVGAAGTLANFGANWAKDGLDWGDVGEGVLGLGLDAATLIPGIGTGAKTAKIMKALKVSAPVIGSAFAAAGLYQASSALKNVLEGKGTMDDWRHIATGLTGAISGKRIGFDKMLGTTKGAKTLSVKANGERIDLDEATANLLESTKGASKKADVVRNFVAGKMNRGLASELDGPRMNPADVKLDKGFGLKYKGVGIGGNDKLGLESVRGESTLRPYEGSNFFQRRAIKRTAMANPNMNGAEEILGNDNRMPTVLGMKVNYAPSSKIKRDAPVTNTEAPRATAPREVASENVSPIASTQTPRRSDPGVQTRMDLDPPQARVEAEETLKPLNTTRIKTDKLINEFLGKGKRSTAPSAMEYTPAKSAEKTSVNYADVKVKKVLESAKVTKEEVKAIAKKAGKSAKLTQEQIKERSDKLINMVSTKRQRVNAETQSSITNTPKEGSSAKSESFMKVYKNNTAKKPALTSKKETRANKKIAKGATGMKLPLPKKDYLKDLDQLLNPKGVGPLLSLGNQTAQFDVATAMGLPQDTITQNTVVPFKPGYQGIKTTGNTQLIAPPADVAVGSRSTGLSDLFNKIDASELGRALYNRQLAKNVDTRVEAPLANNVSEVATPVKGDMFLQNAYNTAADRLTQGANMIRTSDGALQVAGQLASNKQAEDIRMQGAGANNEALARSQAEAIAAQRQYAQGRQQVANANASSLANKTQAERQMQNAKMNAMGKSIDNFWASQDQRAYMQQEQDKMYDRGINDLQVQSKFNPLQAKAAQDYEFASQNLQRAQASGDANAIAAAKAEMEKALIAGNRLASNSKLIQLRLAKNPNWTGWRTDDLSGDLLNPVAANNPSSLQFRTRPGAYATGGKLSAQDKVAIQEYKDQNKAFDNDTKEYNKWLSLRIKEDKKEQTAVGKSIDSLIKQALKTK